MTIIEVKTSAHIKAFHQIPFEIYKNDSNWIPHIKQDVEKVFTKKENKFFRTKYFYSKFLQSLSKYFNWKKSSPWGEV